MKTLKRKYLGGTSHDELAYPIKDIHFMKPPLAYTGGGSIACNNNIYPSNLAYSGTNSPDFPSIHRVNKYTRGGGCGSCGLGNLFNGGAKKHRTGCRCSICKSMQNGGMQNGVMQNGGNGLPYGQGLPDMNAIPYPNGLAGQPWSANVSHWPGVDGISGNRNYLSHNNYNTDVVTDMKDLGANFPFLGGRRRNKNNKNNKSKKNRQKAGDVTNTLLYDGVNLGRQIQHNLGSVYNSMAGYPASPNPLPWKDQLK